MQTFAGIDPGVIHTGVVVLAIDEDGQRYRHFAYAVAGLDSDEVANILKKHRPDQVYIEAYRPRSHFDNDPAMGKMVNELRAKIPNSRTVNNTGVKKVITADLLKIFGLNKFSTRTNHDDLRSAARIMLYGMVKDRALNRLLYDIVSDELNDEPWERV